MIRSVSRVQLMGIAAILAILLATEVARLASY
jgi:hypothetical protein